MLDSPYATMRYNFKTHYLPETSSANGVFVKVPSEP